MRTARAHVTIGRTHYHADVEAGGHPLAADEPTEVGGTDTGPNPWELLCASLAACTAITVRMYADRKGWPMERLDVEVVHSRDASATPPDALHQQVTFEGDLDEAQLARLTEIADRCPVHRALTQGFRASTERVEGATTAGRNA